tara:strand:+ start:525 stop:893 length:369 start_codon:yes stop_codon:yes gene_type:complete
MPIFAKIENEKVVDIIVADQSFIDTQPETFIETKDLVFGGFVVDENFQQTSEVGLRKNTAHRGMRYDSSLDAFYWGEENKKHKTFVFDTASCTWVPPIPKPNDGKEYWWNEDITSWVEVEVP